MAAAYPGVPGGESPFTEGCCVRGARDIAGRMSAVTELSPRAIRAAIVGGDDGGGEVYEMFDVVSVDTAGARLSGPLLLEIGEVLTLRLSRGELRVEVQGRVAAHQRRPEESALGTVSWVEFVGADAAATVRKVVEGA